MGREPGSSPASGVPLEGRLKLGYRRARVNDDDNSRTSAPTHADPPPQLAARVLRRRGPPARSGGRIARAGPRRAGHREARQRPGATARRRRGPRPSRAAGRLVRAPRHAPAAAAATPPAAGRPAHPLAAGPLRRGGRHAGYRHPQRRHAPPVATFHGDALEATVPPSSRGHDRGQPGGARRSAPLGFRAGPAGDHPQRSRGAGSCRGSLAPARRTRTAAHRPGDRLRRPSLSRQGRRDAPARGVPAPRPPAWRARGAGRRRRGRRCLPPSPAMPDAGTGDRGCREILRLPAGRGAFRPGVRRPGRAFGRGTLRPGHRGSHDPRRARGGDRGGRQPRDHPRRGGRPAGRARRPARAGGRTGGHPGGPRPGGKAGGGRSGARAHVFHAGPAGGGHGTGLPAPSPPGRACCGPPAPRRR